ncbi:PP2C family protein-serine/threonine phosphatase [Kineococcus rubinsiae]|uniref:PP2C family protein-serine/threonine phosphatase n=1 Tax=Kineococcus rubinsiae TaxID=2609562 RepID=UPI00143002A0|nr:SpoIIE family protein phosphatase [Kineococcus rubinsiae]NIZ90392.1 SpoIIE family protein phosphatase [Kineococcus rubinsiae]
MPEHSLSTSNSSEGDAEGLLGVLAQFDSLLEGAPLGIGIFDRDLRHVRVNAVLEQMNGQSAHLLLGRTPAEVNGDVGRQAEVLYRQVMDSGSAMRDVRLSGEVSARPGQLRHWSITFHPVRRDGQVVGLCVIVDDVTAEHELSEALAASQRAHQRLAEDLQRDLLPPAHPAVPGADVAAVYRPASAAAAVGGDFYDVIAIDEDRWLLVIGDVQGKGPVAASLSGALRYAVRTAAVIDPDPAQVLATVNDVLVRLDDDRTCTVACLLLQRQQASSGSSWSLRAVSAGHPLPLLVRPDADGAPAQVEALGVPNLLLGVVGGVRYQASTATLTPGESLVLYTDGVTEARAPRHQGHPSRLEDAAVDSGVGADDPHDAAIELFGEARLQALLSATTVPPGAGAASGLAEAVHRAVETFAGGSSGDDLTLLVLHLPAHP